MFGSRQEMTQMEWVV